VGREGAYGVNSEQQFMLTETLPAIRTPVSKVTAFILIELLVVIDIIDLIIAILLQQSPTLGCNEMNVQMRFR
jgi:hypothetical protein